MYVVYCIIFVGSIFKYRFITLQASCIICTVCRFGSVINIRNYGAVTVERNKEVRWECILQKAGARKSRETVIYCKSSAREKWLKRVSVKTFNSERNFLFKVFIDFKYIMLCFNIFNMFKQQEFCIAIIQ